MAYKVMLQVLVANDDRTLVDVSRGTVVHDENPPAALGTEILDSEEHVLDVVKTALDALDLVAEDTREQVRRIARQYVSKDWREFREELERQLKSGPPSA